MKKQNRREKIKKARDRNSKKHIDPNIDVPRTIPKNMCYKVTAMDWSDPDFFPSLDNEYYDTFEEAIAAKDRLKSAGSVVEERIEVAPR
jgi:hypothetical protein